MARYRVTTPDTPRALGVAYADFQAATELTSPVCVRRLLERHNFTGCTVHRKRRGNHWELIFESPMNNGLSSHLTLAAHWYRVEAAQWNS